MHHQFAEGTLIEVPARKPWDLRASSSEASDPTLGTWKLELLSPPPFRRLELLLLEGGRCSRQFSTVDPHRDPLIV
jgi:hypothetical protein